MFSLFASFIFSFYPHTAAHGYTKLSTISTAYRAAVPRTTPRTPQNSLSVPFPSLGFVCIATPLSAEAAPHHHRLLFGFYGSHTTTPHTANAGPVAFNGGGETSSSSASSLKHCSFAQPHTLRGRPLSVGRSTSKRPNNRRRRLFRRSVFRRIHSLTSLLIPRPLLLYYFLLCFGAATFCCSN